MRTEWPKKGIRLTHVDVEGLAKRIMRQFDLKICEHVLLVWLGVVQGTVMGVCDWFVIAVCCQSVTA